MSCFGRGSGVADRLRRCLELMVDAYDPRAKSAHWERRFTPAVIQRLLDGSTLAQFRDGSDKLSDGMDDDLSWIRTADAYRRLTAQAGTGWLHYAEAEIGKPKTYRVAGHRLNPHDIALCQYLDSIARHVERPETIVEIGGGFGALAHKLKLRWPDARYIGLDLPEALTLQAYYLNTLHPGARFYLYDDLAAGRPMVDYDFALLPGWLAGHVPDGSVDLVVNTRSMMEMTSGVIADYFEHIHRFLRTGGVFYNVNRYEKTTVGEPIRIAEYPYDDRWQVLASLASFFQSHVHELVTLRLSPGARGDIGEVLAGLPRTGPPIRSRRLPPFERFQLLWLGLRSLSAAR